MREGTNRYALFADWLDKNRNRESEPLSSPKPLAVR